MDHTVNPSAHDDAEQHDQAYQTTQYYNILPGADVAYPPFQRVESSLQTSFAQSTTEMPISTIPPYVDSQCEGSGTTPYAPYFPNQTLPLPYPNPEHARRISSHEYGLQPMSRPGSNVRQSRPSAHHSRVLSQPNHRPLSLAIPSGGRGPVYAGPGPYAGPSHLTPPVLNFESDILQLGLSLAPQSANFVTHSIPHSQSPDPAASSFARRHSEADVSHKKNVSPDPQAFVNQPTSTAYSHVPPHPAFPLANSNTQYPASGPINTIQGTPSHPQGDHAARVDLNFSFPLSSSSELLDDSVSVASLFESVSPGPSDGAGHELQQGTASGPQQKRRRPGKRKRAAEPKDLKAAERLRNQRGMDDKNIEILYRLFVPNNADMDMVPKKDRLETIVQFATNYVESVGAPEPQGTTARHHLSPQGGDIHNERPQPEFPGAVE